MPYEQNHYAAHNAQSYLNVKMVELNDVFIGNQSNLPEDSTLSLIIYTQNGVTLHSSIRSSHRKEVFLRPPTHLASK